MLSLELRKIVSNVGKDMALSRVGVQYTVCVLVTAILLIKSEG